MGKDFFVKVENYLDWDGAGGVNIVGSEDEEAFFVRGFPLTNKGFAA